MRKKYYVAEYRTHYDTVTSYEFTARNLIFARIKANIYGKRLDNYKLCRIMEVKIQWDRKGNIRYDNFVL